jgi:hypothetical protein
MLPKYHILIGFVCCALLVIFFNLSWQAAVIIFLASVLIDFDHYISYVIDKKDIPLKNAYRWFVSRKKLWFSLPQEQREKYKRVTMLFHGIEFWAIPAILSVFYDFFLWVLLGIAIHMIIDLAEFIYLGEPLYAKLSQIFVYITNKKKVDLISS